MSQHTLNYHFRIIAGPSVAQYVPLFSELNIKRLSALEIGDVHLTHFGNMCQMLRVRYMKM